VIYEHKAHPPIPPGRFARRVVLHALAALLLLGSSLLLGMAGYEYFEGPVDAPRTDGGKLFAGLYALYAGLVFLVAAGLVFTPLMHRVLHKFHWAQDE
jgi:hypothetical protein